MASIRVKSHVGADGRLSLELPTDVCIRYLNGTAIGVRNRLCDLANYMAPLITNEQTLTPAGLLVRSATS